MTNPVTPAGAPVPPPSGGGMPKWLIFVLVAVLVIMLGCCGGFVACNWMCSKVVTTGGQAANSFVANQLKNEGVQADTTGNGLALPANFPSDVPVYAGFKATNIVAPPGRSDGEVTFTGKESLDKIAAFYQSTLTGKGWTQDLNNVSDALVTQSYSKDGQIVGVIATSSNGDCSLFISFAKK